MQQHGDDVAVRHYASVASVQLFATCATMTVITLLIDQLCKQA